MSTALSNNLLVFTQAWSIEWTSIQRIQTDLADRALQTLWQVLSEQIANAPNLTSTEEIQAWFNRPANKAILNGITELDLQNRDLHVVPSQIAKCLRLKVLLLGGNQLKSIPYCLSKLTSLEQLSLHYNMIEEIPDFLGRFTQLKVLHLNNNQICNFPHCIFRLWQLNVLTLDHNCISDIPDRAFRFFQLTELCLDNNALHKIPDWVFSCAKLNRLQIDNNLITHHQKDICKLTNLEEISLLENPFDEVMPIEICFFLLNHQLLQQDQNIFLEKRRTVEQL